jgi:predicted nuclease of predicted toxin-antitoxin system
VRFLLDECCSAALEAALTAIGLDTISIRSIALGLPDQDVMAKAYSENRLLVTHDYDLPELAIRYGAPCRGILLIAYDTALTRDDLAQIARLVHEWGERLAGAVTIIDGDRVRTRPL